MTYQYRIVIRTLQTSAWSTYYYSDSCQVDFQSESYEAIKKFIECYGSTNDPQLFLEQLLALFPSVPSHPGQSEHSSDLSDDQLKQQVQSLVAANKSLQVAKQELEEQVSTLSRTKENREVEKLREEKADLKREKDQLARDNKYFESQIAKTQRDLEHSQQQLSSQQIQNNQYYQGFQEYERKYKELVPQWNKLLQDYEALQKRLTGTHTIEQENEKLKKSRQTLENRVQEIKQELQETQQKLSLATMRLRGVNTHSELGGGGSRSDQLKNEFSQIKMGLFHDASSKVLNGWRDQGSNLTFRSEEFSQIKSILSQRVFGDGMAYFAQDKTEVNTELHLVMDALSDIKDFSPTPAIFQEIQEKVQVGLLRAKGVDHSDEAIEKYIEEITQRIDQDLKSIANLATADEALYEIKEFVEKGLKIVRDTVNDTNSGELFIPENGTTFDDNAHEPKDDHQGLIKMTICAGYRIKSTILVKADVLTYEPEPVSQSTEINSLNPQNFDSPVYGTQEPQYPQHNGNDFPKVEGTTNISESISMQDRPSPPSPTNSFQDHLEVGHESQTTKEAPKFLRNFKGKVTHSSGVMFRSVPKREAKIESKSMANHGEILNFEAWTVGEPWNEDNSSNQSQNDRWYKYAGQDDMWLPAFHIEVEGDLPTDLEIKGTTGEKDEVQ
jgi:myosin heavy subunit